MPEQQFVSIGQMLTEDAVLIRSPQKDRSRLLETLVAKVCSAKSLKDPRKVFQKVLEREKDGIDTTLDTGLSIPHAHVSGLLDSAAGLAIPAHNILDPVNPKIPIRAMLLLISPDSPEANKQHLKLLREVAILFRPALIDQLARLASSTQAIELIRRQEHNLNIHSGGVQ